MNYFLINLEGAYEVANGGKLFKNMVIIVQRGNTAKSTNVADDGLKSALMHVRSFRLATLEEMLCGNDTKSMGGRRAAAQDLSV